MGFSGEGALGGAATGAAIGSVAGPWGAAAGGALGGLAGGFGLFGDGPGSKEIDPRNAQFEDRFYLRNLYQSGVDDTLYRQGQPPQAGQTQVDPHQQAQVRNQQMAQANRLAAIAQGQQQGAGELAAQRQGNRSIAQQQALARMGRGQAGMQRAAARNVADLGTSIAGQSQLAAIQDQQSANNQLGQLLGQARGQDQSIAAQNAQLDQQRQLANVDMQLRAQGLNDQTRLAYLGALAQMNQAEMAGRLGQEQVMMQQPGLFGPMLQAGGQIAAAYAMRPKDGGG